MAGGIMISPNLKKTRVLLDVHGNEYNPQTKEVIGNVNETYVPTPEELKKAESRVAPTEQELIEARKEIRSGAIEVIPKNSEPAQSANGNPLADMIKKEVRKAVLESVKEINIAEMVKEAVADAFK